MTPFPTYLEMDLLHKKMLVHFLSSIASKELDVKKISNTPKNTLNNSIEGNLVKKLTNYRRKPYDIEPFTLCKKL